MVTRVVVGIVALVCASTSGIVASFANLEMVDKVNEKLPSEDQFGQLGWYWSKNLRLRQQYKRLYPSGRLLLKIRMLLALMLTSLLVCAWSIRLFGS